jgi:hypothetical protein
MRVHLVFVVYLLVSYGVAQTDEGKVISKVTSLPIEDGSVTVLHLGPGYATSVRLPEEASSIVVGNPAAFKGEHSESEPKLVFFKPVTSQAGLVGRGSLTQSLSAGDLLRERVGNNIGQAGDQEVSRLSITEHLVVTVAANTEIYVVLERSEHTPIAPKAKPASETIPGVSGSLGIQELRQLLQLQKELNQNASTPKANQ